MYMDIYSTCISFFNIYIACINYYDCMMFCIRSCAVGINTVESYLIHPMQIWRTTPSSPGTSCMKARLVEPRCFVLTSFLRKVLLRSRSRLVYFAMSTSMPPEGSEIFHRKESFFSFLVRL